MTDEQKLTIKQRKFIRLYLQTGNASFSATKAGYSIRESGYENLTKPLVRNALLQLMDKSGITDKKLNKVLKDGLNAKRIVAVEMQGEDEKRIEVPDLTTRHKYLETALKVKGNAFERQEAAAPVINTTVSVVNNNLRVMKDDDLDSHIAGIIARRQGSAVACVGGEGSATPS